MYKNAVKKLSFVIMYVPDQYKTPEMYDKVNIENGGVLRFVSDCYKNVLHKKNRQCVVKQWQLFSCIRICSKLLYDSKMCNKAVDIYPSAIQFSPDQCVAQNMCDKIVNVSLPTLKFVLEWFVMNKMVEKLDDV